MKGHGGRARTVESASIAAPVSPSIRGSILETRWTWHDQGRSAAVSDSGGHGGRVYGELKNAKHWRVGIDFLWCGEGYKSEQTSLMEEIAVAENNPREATLQEPQRHVGGGVAATMRLCQRSEK